ncbi:MAG: hypothetical protein C5B50_05485 [Verrucomicrobia bacterium]|nr:MAG: hypothetical protein C5B50_05485 [Verrucomicrobiota bacterium]
MKISAIRDLLVGSTGLWLAMGAAIFLLTALAIASRFGSSHRSEIVARIKWFSWDRRTFCQHFLITGATGSGKTLGGILRLLFQVFKHEPRFGGLCVDVKGLLHEKVVEMAKHFGRPDDVVVLQVRSNSATTEWRPVNRLNLVGDRSIPFGTYARCVADTAAALGNRQEQTFFRRAGQIHIGKGLEALHALGYEVTLENVHNMLVNPGDTARVVKELGTKETTRGLAEHFQNYLAQPPEQLAGIVGTVGNYLHYFTEPAIAEVFCRDSTFALEDVDKGKIICLALPQKYQTERRFVGTFLKLLFFTHALSRFDADAKRRQLQNMLLFLADEYQQFVTASEDGLSDHSVIDLAREALMAVVAATQSTTSFVPALGTDQAKVLTLNLRNRLIFTSADEDDAKAAAEFLGRKTVKTRSWTWSNGKRSETFTETEDYRVKPHQLRKLRKHQCIVAHANGRFRKFTLPPVQPDGTVPNWYRRSWFTL